MIVCRSVQQSGCFRDPILFRSLKTLLSILPCATAGHDLDSHVAKSAQAVGLNIGIAYQITRDMLVTERNYEKLWAKVNKCSENGEPVTFDQYELNEPLQRAATLIYVLDHDPALRVVIQLLCSVSCIRIKICPKWSPTLISNRMSWFTGCCRV